MAIVLEDEFGDIISKARGGTGLSTQEVADQIGVPVNDLEQMERYQLIPDDGVIGQLADVLTLDAECLIDIARGRWTPKDPEGRVGAEMVLERLSVGGAYKANCYIVGCAHTKEGIVIDPGDNGRSILDSIRSDGRSIRYILLTHGHGDHTGALSEVQGATGARMFIHREDRALLGGVLPKGADTVGDGDSLHFGQLEILARHTPGHSMGGMSYVVGDVAFVGDTLFAGSLGRATRRGNYPILLRSAREKILTLKDETTLFPGHGPATTVGEEKAHNPFLRCVGV